jgi:hypothetical protein
MAMKHGYFKEWNIERLETVEITPEVFKAVKIQLVVLWVTLLPSGRGG